MRLQSRAYTDRLPRQVPGEGTSGTDLLVSCKTQNVGGTAEEKIAYEIIKLAHALENSPERYGERAVIVMDGDGWSAGMRNFVDNDVKTWIPRASNVVLYSSAEEFVSTEFPDRYVPPSKLS